MATLKNGDALSLKELPGELTAQVPKGYDGLVFTILGTGLDYDSSDYLIDYYDPAAVVTYRLDGQPD